MAFKMKGFPMHRGTSGFKKAVTEYSALKAEDDRNPADESYAGEYAAEDKWAAMSNDEQQKWLAEYGGASEAIQAIAEGKNITMTGSDKGEDKDEVKVKDEKKLTGKDDDETAAGDTTAAGDNKPTRTKYDEAKEKNPDLDKHIKTRNDPNASELEKAEAQDAINEAYGKGPTNRAEKVRAKQEKEKSEGGGDTKATDTKATDTKATDTKDDSDDTRELDHRNAADRKKMTHKEIFKQKQAERKAKRSERQRRRAAIDAWRRGGSKGPMPQKSNNWGEGSSPAKIYSKPKGKRTKY